MLSPPRPDGISRTLQFSSSIELVEALNKGILKDPYTFDGKIHEMCVPTSREDDQTTLDGFWNYSIFKPFNTKLAHLQDWFTKLSHKNKLCFLRRLVEVMDSSKMLYDVAYFIGPPSKDLIYAKSQFTRSSYDVAPNDHDRALDDVMASMDTYEEWFQSLNEQQRFCVFIGLGHLGGSAVQVEVYQSIVNLLEKKEQDFIRTKVLEYLAQKKNRVSHVISSKVAHHKHRHLKRRESATKAKSVKSRKQSEPGEEPDNLAQLQNKIDKFNNALKAMKQIAEGSSHELKNRGRKRETPHKRRKSSKIETTKKRHRHDSGIDRVQMLTIWDNRRIFAMLPEKSLVSYSSVNRYWKESIDRTRRELRVRKQIDKFLRESVEHSVKIKLNVEKSKSKTGKQQSEESKSTRTADNLMPEDFHRRLQVEQAFPKKFPKYNPFARPYGEYIVCSTFVDNRAMDVTKRWVAYSKITDIEFSNLNVGVPCNLAINGAHAKKISCLCFHPNGSEMFTGSFDGSVRRLDVWHKSVKLVYAPHKGVVLDVVASCKYVASCSMDGTIRLFNIADGRCLSCFSLNQSYPNKLLMTNCNNPLLYVANNVGEITLHQIAEEKASDRLGSILYAHKGEVTCMRHHPCVLLTAGVDGFVRMWATNLRKPRWIVSLKHPVRVNSAELARGKILSASEDGKLRIWDVMSERCERVVNANWKPILSMNYLEGSAIKIVLNSDINIKVLEFPLKGKDKLSETGKSMLSRNAHLNAKIRGIQPSFGSSEKNMMKLHMRQAVLPSIRPNPKIRSRQLLQDRQTLY